MADTEKKEMGRDGPQGDLGQDCPLIRLCRWLTAGSLLISVNALADWLNLCPTADVGVAQPGYLNHIAREGHRFDRASLTQQPEPAAGCLHREVPFTRGDVLWSRTLAGSLATHTVTHLALQGRATADDFRVGELIWPETAQPAANAARPLAAPGTSLLPHLLDTAFGEEGRAQVERVAGQLRLNCRAGSQPAGAILHAESALPRHAALQFRLEGDGQGQFAVGISDQRRAQSGDPMALGAISLGHSADGWYGLPIPQDAQVRGDWQSLTINCPLQASTLNLRSLRLNSAKPLAAKTGRASWFWSPAVWQRDRSRIYAQQARWKLNHIYIGVAMQGEVIGDTDALRNFVAEAHGRGLKVSVVFGEPAAIYPEGRLLYQGYLRSMARYNEAASASARLDGVQLDIEPYLDPGFSSGAETWKPQYRDAIADIAAVSPVPVELVLPFWLGNDTPWLDDLAPLIGSLAVMDYRTDPNRIAEAAAPFLEWGSRHDKPVTIALETLPFAPETRRHFGRAEAGELIVMGLGQQTLLILLKKPVAVADAVAYRWGSTREVNADQVSFAGREAELVPLLTLLEAQLNAWDSFAGLAIHGLDQPEVPPAQASSPSP